MTAETNPSSNRMLRTTEAAVSTGLSASTLNKLRLAGDGPVYLKLGKAVVYDTADLSAWLSFKRRPPPIFARTQSMKKLIMDCVLASIALPSSDDSPGSPTDSAVVPANLEVNQLIVKHGIEPWLANWLSQTHGWGKDR